MTAAVDLFGRPERTRPPLKQLPLPLGWRSGSAEPLALLVSESNRALLAAVLDWQNWVTPVALLVGPPRSGKSLLAAHVADLNPTVRIVDPARDMDETALFHACTAAIADQSPLLMVAEPQWQVALPDLATRLSAAQDFAVPDPDNELLAALLERRLADSHIALAPDVANYIAQRMERSFGALDAVCASLCAGSLAEGQRLTIAFARRMLGDAETAGA